jgi:cell division control protein 6
MPPVLKNKRALDPEYVPEVLQGRNSALDTLRAALKPIVSGFRTDPICLFGPSGAGKATLAKYVVQQLERPVPALEWGYVDAMTNSSSHDLVFELCRELGVATTRRRQGTSTTALLEELRQLDDHAIVIVDEAGFLEDPSILADRYGVSHGQISQDMDRISAHGRDRLHGRGRRALVVDTVVQRCVQELMNDGQYRAAAKIVGNSGQAFERGTFPRVTARIHGLQAVVLRLLNL